MRTTKCTPAVSVQSPAATPARTTCMRDLPQRLIQSGSAPVRALGNIPASIEPLVGVTKRERRGGDGGGGERERSS